MTAHGHYAQHHLTGPHAAAGYYHQGVTNPAAAAAAHTGAGYYTDGSRLSSWHGGGHRGGGGHWDQHHGHAGHGHHLGAHDPDIAAVERMLDDTYTATGGAYGTGYGGRGGYSSYANGYGAYDTTGYGTGYGTAGYGTSGYGYGATSGYGTTATHSAMYGGHTSGYGTGAATTGVHFSDARPTARSRHPGAFASGAGYGQRRSASEQRPATTRRPATATGMTAAARSAMPGSTAAATTAGARGMTGGAMAAGKTRFEDPFLNQMYSNREV